jgi:methylenetetrahydrofolate dehydrogenase (NADP+)/methenyltetrahydrofolate cyclohydrolase
MSAIIIDGKKIAAEIKQELAAKVAAAKQKPGIAVILVGLDPASQTYVSSKEKDSQEIGYHSEVYRLPETTTEAEVLALIDKLNKDPKIHGMLVQLPVPKHINEEKITLAIDPRKDADCFHPYNTGRVFNGDFSGVLPCTPAGCLVLIKSTGVDLRGKKAVIIGRSNIVGKPAALMMLNEHCTVTICHSRTKDLAAEVKQADIVIAAVGKPGIVTGDMIKPGAIVIDVGTNRVNGKLVGDVDFDSVVKVAGYITPVPGGVGPMTRALLMKNTFTAFSSQK